MPKIRVETLDGKVLTRNRVRAQRMVDSGTHRWKDNRTLEELVPQSSASESRRFLQVNYAASVVFDYDYPVGPEPEKDPHYLPYTYPLPYDILRHYLG